MVFPTFFNLSLNFAKRSRWSEPQSAPGLVFAHCESFSIFDCKEYNQSDFGTDHLVVSMCRVISCAGRRVCLLCSLGRLLLVFPLLHFVPQGQTCLLLQVCLDFLLLHSSPWWWRSKEKNYQMQTMGLMSVIRTRYRVLINSARVNHALPKKRKFYLASWI